MGDEIDSKPPIHSASSFEITIPVALEGAYAPAQKAFVSAVRDYAESLSRESEYEEISSRAPGAKTAEITESAVLRAQETLNRKIAEKSIGAGRKSVNFLEGLALAGSPIFSGATGIMGSYLNQYWQITVFIFFAVTAVSCVLYLLWRRLL